MKRIAMVVSTLFLLFFVTGCPDPEQKADPQACQLKCSNELVRAIDQCDADNPPPSIVNGECIREQINAYRLCIAECE